MPEIPSHKKRSVITLFKNYLVKRYIFHIGERDARRGRFHQNAILLDSGKQIIYRLCRKAEFFSVQNIVVFRQNPAAAA